jgi:ATP-dependent DNA helicase DinG
VRAVKRFSESSLKKLREEIADAGGNEVFALGWIGEDGLVARVEIAARGTLNSVLAPEKGAGAAGFDLLGGGKESPDLLIHNHPSGFLTPSDNDLVISSRAAEGGTGSFIVDNPVEQVYVVAEPVRRKARIPLDTGAMRAALEEGGAVARRLPSYENREAQLNLMDLIIRGFNEDALVAAEAGTGVGKSFAYLLPAVSFALANDERVLISTATITLQQQLYEKDIPLVLRALNAKVKAVLMKGRGNYLCRRRLEDALREPLMEEEEHENLRALTLWAEKTATGSRSDLPFQPPEGLWSRVCSEADMCMGMRCPERERCFVMILRRESADAGILVVNHHLLFADLAARHEGAGYEGTVVLPPCGRIVIDEAHTVEEAATSFFSQEWSRLGIYRQLGRLYRKKKGGGRLGLLVRMAALLPGGEGSRFFGSPGEEKGDKVWQGVQKIRNTTDALNEAALELCGASGVFRLVPSRDEVVRTLLVPRLVELRKNINSLGSLIRDMTEILGKDKEDENVVWEVRAASRRLDRVCSVCTAFIEYRENPGRVMWIERHPGRPPFSADWAAFNATPINVAPELSDSLFRPNKTVVCVSATLTAGNSFNYWNGRTGLNLVTDRQRYSGVFPSPFPYEKSVLLGAVPDAPIPGEEGFGVFVDGAVAALTESAGGSALVLFTSYEALRSAWEKSRPILEDQGIQVLKQGDDDRMKLLNTFLADEKSVLFATDSFWEGVDAPGDTLRLVILCRLPFRTPSEPVFEARCELVEQRGGSAFMDLSLPEAVMKFKQGFGRLIRRSGDRGVVVVLDGRLVRKRYGEFFLRSLPKTKTCFADFKTLLRRTEDFLYP